MLRRLFASDLEWKLAIAIVAVTLAVFGPFALQNGFVSLDDDYLIYNNPAVLSMTPATVWHVFTTYDPQLYIPLTFVTFQINAIFSMSSAGFHIVNLLLHCANAVLVLIILRKLSGSTVVAVTASALFALHPLQTEAVLWAASRKDLLSGFFFLLSTSLYLRNRDNAGRRTLLLSIIFFGLGLLSKVSIILLPLWLLSIDWLQGRQLSRRIVTEKWPFAVLAVLFGIIAVIGKSRVLASSGGLVNILLPGKSALFYLQKIVVPTGLSVIYPYIPGEHLVSELGWTFGILIAIGICTLALIIRGRHRFVAFCIATYFLLLAPSFSTFWKNGFLYFASDRYAYLALIGAFGLIGLLIDRIGHIAHNQKISFGIAGALVALVLPLTYLQSRVWASSEALYRNVVAIYPESVVAQTNLGLELQKKRSLVEAREHYERAIALDPSSVHAYFNLASLENEEGHPEEARRLYLKIVDAFGPIQIATSSDVRAFLWLLTRLDELGHGADADRLAQKMVEIAGHLPETHNALGERYRAQGKDREAQLEFEAAAARGSKNPHTYFYLTEYYSGAGLMEKAIEALREGVRLDPTNTAARQKLEEVTR